MKTFINDKTFGVVVKETKKSNEFISFFKKITESLGRVGKALMFPIAMLPIAALLNRLGAQIPTNIGIENAPPFVHFVQSMLSAAGNTVFNNLHILFAIGVGFGLTKNNRGEAGIAAFVGMILLTLIMSKEGANLPNQIYGGINFPINQGSLDAGQISKDAQGFERIFGNSYDKILANNVLNGIIAGSLVAWIYNRFNEVELPRVLGFFSGKRLIPVLVILSILGFGILYAIIFPWIGWTLYQISIGLSSATGNRWGNAAIAGVYGFINRLLIPFGLHHVPNTLFWFVLGQHPGTSGSDVFGDINIFLNGIANGNTAGTFQSGFFPVMMFGLPTLSLVFYKNAESKEQKQKILSMFLPLSLISFLTGITEPIEFAFMFISPLLYILHALLTGVFAFITGAFGIQIGFGFSAGLIDYLLSIPKSLEIIKANRNGVDAIFANPGWLIPIGALCSVSYFFVGNVLVKKLNLSTPGRGNNLIVNDDKNNDLNNNQYNSNELSNKIKKLVLGLGGWDNIENYQNCVTRLRYDVKNMNLINEDLLKEGGAAGIKKFDEHHIHVIIGTNAEMINNEITNNKFSSLEIAKQNNESLVQINKRKSTLTKPIFIKSSISGKVISLDKMENGIFSAMGKGIAIIPKNKKIIAPTKLKLDLSYDTGHAFAFDYDGIKLLMHIGVGTNKINSSKTKGDKLEVFDSKYIGQENITLKKDEIIVNVDLNKLKELKYDSITALVLLNESLINCEVEILVKENQIISIGDNLFKVKPNKN